MANAFWWTWARFTWSSLLRLCACPLWALLFMAGSMCCKLFLRHWPCVCWCSLPWTTPSRYTCALLHSASANTVCEMAVHLSSGLPGCACYCQVLLADTGYNMVLLGLLDSTFSVASVHLRTLLLGHSVHVGCVNATVCMCLQHCQCRHCCFCMSACAFATCLTATPHSVTSFIMQSRAI